MKENIHSIPAKRAFLKKGLLLGVLLMFGLISWAQVPSTMSYEAVARDEKGFPIANKDIVVEISLRTGSSNGPIQWQEVHYVTTNTFGLFSIEIGGSSGIKTEMSRLSSFDKIDWSSTDFFIQTRVDFGSAVFLNGFLEMGSTKLVSVPYAFVADTALNVPIPGLTQILGVNEATLKQYDVVKWSGTAWVVDTITRSGGTTSVDLSNYLTRDGLTDLTGNWTIATRSIALNNGNLSVGTGALTLGSGHLTLNQGNINVSEGNVLVTIGLVSTPTLRLNSISLNAVSTDISTNFSNQAIPTALAVKNYVLANAGASYWSLASGFVFNTANFIGIGTSAPESRFHVSLQNSEAMLVTGSFQATSDIPSMGGGTRLVFYPIRGALRAGTVASDQWNNSNVGSHSVAFGSNTIADGDFSFAHGENSSALGSYAVAFGNSNTSSGSKSFTIGKSNTASGASSATFGENNISSGTYSLASGFGSIARGDASVTLGESSETGLSANGSLAGGFKSLSFAKYSFAIGEQSQTNTTAQGSLASGFSANTYGRYSFASGDNVAAVSYAEVAFGRYNTISGGVDMLGWNSGDRLFVLGNGTDGANRKNAIVVLKNGNMGIGVDIPTAALQVSGNIVASGTITQASDIRYKKDIESLAPYLSKILSLQPVNYQLRTNEFPNLRFADKKQIGLIAQEVEKIIPELVETDPNGFKSIDYARLSVILLKAMQEQNELIEKLKQDNTQLSTKINANAGYTKELENRVDKIETLLNMAGKK